MACHQINLPPMTSTSTRNILPGNQITQNCFTAGEKTEINIIFFLRRLLKAGQEHQNEQENRYKYGRILKAAWRRRFLATPGYQLRPGLSDLRGRGIRKARVVIGSAALRRNREGTSGEGRYLLFQWPQNNVAPSGFILHRYETGDYHLFVYSI